MWKLKKKRKCFNKLHRVLCVHEVQHLYFKIVLKNEQAYNKNNIILCLLIQFRNADFLPIVAVFLLINVIQILITKRWGQLKNVQKK